MAAAIRPRFVHLLQHTTREGSDDEDIKVLGIFSSDRKAKSAIAYFRKLPGFKQYPKGFHIDRYRLNQREWREGFFTYRYAPKRRPKGESAR